MKLNRLTTMVILAMVLGVLVGYACHAWAPTPEAAKEIAGYFGLLTDIFLRMIKMIIAPWCLRPWLQACLPWAIRAPLGVSARGRWLGSWALR